MSQPEMIPVVSSNIERIGYDEGNQEVWVEFQSGRTYVYSEVPEATFREFESSPSLGSYLNRQLKPHYPVREP